MTRTAHICPKCGLGKVIPVAYGLPSLEMFELAKRGEIALGGCIVGGEDPRLECVACKHRWNDQIQAPRSSPSQ
jgi:hypothetical protein